MAPQSSSKSRSGGSSRSNPALIPGLIALVLIVIAIVAAVMTKKKKGPDVVAPIAASPFADMPPEVAPPAKVHTAKSSLPPAPANIASEPQWISAKALAVEALELFEATMSAKAKGDLATATTKGKASREKYSAAIETTAVWEEDLMSKYNPNDGEIIAIRDTRSDWFNKLRVLQTSVLH